MSLSSAQSAREAEIPVAAVGVLEVGAEEVMVGRDLRTGFWGAVDFEEEVFEVLDFLEDLSSASGRGLREIVSQYLEVTRRNS